MAHLKPMPPLHEQCERMASIGMTTEQIAWCVNLTPYALYDRMKNDQLLAHSIKIGKAKGLERVTKTAFEMATSGKDTAMTIFWLKTQAGWKDRSEIDIKFIRENYGVDDFAKLNYQQLAEISKEVAQVLGDKARKKIGSGSDAEVSNT